MNDFNLVESRLVADALAAANAEIDALVASCATREELMQALDNRIKEGQAFVSQWISRHQLEIGG